MLIKSLSRIGMVSCLVALSPQLVRTAAAEEVITYKIREDPQDSSSMVVFEVSLELRALEQDGNSIGWNINAAEFTQMVDGKPGSVWTKAAPLGNNKWWVEHADPSNPVPEEFDEVPFMQGAAVAGDPNDPDLDYDLEGFVYTGYPPPYSGKVSSWTYAFTRANETKPAEEGEDEPVEIDGEEEPD